MAVNYQIVLRTATGNALKVVDDFTVLDYTRVVNSVGALTLTLPDRFDTTKNLYLFDLFNQPDNRIEVWRQVDGRLPYLDAEAVWFIVYAERNLLSDGTRAFTVIAVDAVDLLSRRFVLYAADQPQANKTGPQDNIMRAIVRENLGSLATDTTRDLSVYLTIPADVGLAPSGSKSCAWQNVLSTLQEIANNAAATTQATPTYLAFDIVCLFNSSNNSIIFEFRTYVNWRGVDHRSGVGLIPVMLSPDAGNFYSANLAYDYRPERNTILAVGNGAGSARLTATAQDTARSSVSPFNRREHVQQSAGIALSAATLQAEANAVLRQSRYQRSFTGQLIQQPTAQYGVHYAFGDVVPVTVVNNTLNARISGVHVAISAGEEKIDAVFVVDPLL